MRFFRSAFCTTLFFLCFFIPAPLCAVAQDAYYVTTSELPQQLLPPPPKEGSEAWKRDIQGVTNAQQHLQQSDIDAMHDEQGMRLELMTDVLGADFNRGKLPNTFALLSKVYRNVSYISESNKFFWRTRRPYLTDPRVKLMINPLDTSPSYPSGHTCQSRVLAEVLGLLYPEKLEALRARADAIALHRVEAGVHYPSDIEGGKLLAMLIVGAMMKSDVFQSDLADAREEIAQ